MPADQWLGDVGDLRSDPVVDVFVDRANATAPRVIADPYFSMLDSKRRARFLDGAYATDPAQYTATAGPAA